MQLNVYLLFNGQCEVAFKYYEQHLGGKIESLFRHAGSPAEAQVPAEWGDKILHGKIVVGDTIVMASDAPPGHYQQPQGFSVSIQAKNVAEAERLFKALAENGTVQMPLQPTFWSAGFAMLVDQFGIPWMINCEQA